MNWNTRRISHLTFEILLAIALVGCQRAPRDQETPPAPSTLEELEAGILEALESTNTPSGGVALISRDEVLWQGGFGNADFAESVDTSADTVFRLGSISKTFVSVAVLQVVEDGLLSLDSPVRDLVPEIEFDNPWSESDPVRVVHLLEHTSGFDEVHFVEIASDDPTPLTLRQGLDLHPDSRIARWRPGTRFSYTNSGPALAAYVVEKITGQRFEDYVQDRIFDPLKMDSASYFLSEGDGSQRAGLYRPNGSVAPYLHILFRPSGALNASASDMARFMRMLLNGGELEGERILSERSVDRMRTPTTTLGAQQGLEFGYGLGLYPDVQDGFVHYGHGGGIGGGAASAEFLPEQGVGYVALQNVGNGRALQQIVPLIRGYLTREFNTPTLPSALADMPEVAYEYSGFYRPIAPRYQLWSFAERLMRIHRLTVTDSELRFRSILTGQTDRFLPISDRLARLSDEPITNLVLLDTPNDRTQIQTGRESWARVPAGLVLTEFVLLFGSLTLIASSLLFALVWIPRRLFGKLRGQSGIGVRAWPLLASVLFVALTGLFVTGSSGRSSLKLGEPSFYSVGIMLVGYAFFFASIWGIAAVWRTQRQIPIRPMLKLHSFLVCGANGLVASYLAYWGWIGIRTWAY